MVNAFDLSRFGQNQNSGYFNTPLMMGMDPSASQGASNPTGSYLQSMPTQNNQINSGSLSWDGLRGVTPPKANTGSGGNSSGLGWNVGTAQLALGGLQTLGNLWQAWEANKLAKEQFKFSKDITNANMANQIQSYNTTLEDRTRARTHVEGGTQEAAQSYIDKNSLRRNN